MNNIFAELKLGEVVISVKGRDSGSLYLITDFSLDKKGYILVADGRMHSTKKPKLKNVKHIMRTDVLLEEILQKIKGGKNYTQTEVFNTLKAVKKQVVLVTNKDLNKTEGI